MSMVPDQRSPPGADSLDKTWSRTDGSSGSGSTPASLIPGLTILFHPDFDRIGERAGLAGLVGGSVELSRQTPEFAAPGAATSQPLADQGLSRQPLRLRHAGDRIVFDRGASSRTRLSLDGREIEATASCGAKALEDGVVLLLGGRVVLLLHLLDPIADLETPRFGLVGESPALTQVRRDIVRTADLEVPILLRGESGTGKELVARAIHEASPRSRRPYVAVNMAAIPGNLAASELFGAERGAFTGSDRNRAGFFEQASSGTLFLDEIGETPVEVQALLLRALEGGEIQRVGGERPRTVDVRVVSATDADLEAAAHDGTFRSPLLHRLSGYVLRLPPLRHRREDFGRLFAFFLRRELESLGSLHLVAPRRHPWLPAALVARLAAWHWPGNVRQLANVVRQLVIANRGDDPATRFSEVEDLLRKTPAGPQTAEPPPLDAPAPHPPAGPRKPSDLSEAEVVAALRAHRFRPGEAADALGIPRSSIYSLIDKIPSLRKAAELSREEIEDARARAGPSLEAVAAELEVSERALRRRLGELES